MEEQQHAGRHGHGRYRELISERREPVRGAQQLDDRQSEDEPDEDAVFECRRIAEAGPKRDRTEGPRLRIVAQYKKLEKSEQCERRNEAYPGAFRPLQASDKRGQSPQEHEEAGSAVIEFGPLRLVERQSWRRRDLDYVRVR